jgi:hypothetical protein
MMTGIKSYVKRTKLASRCCKPRRPQIKHCIGYTLYSHAAAVSHAAAAVVAAVAADELNGGQTAVCMHLTA